MALKLKSLPQTLPYSNELALLVCYHIAMGGTMLEAARQSGLPNDFTIYQWLFDYPDFAQAYDRAQEIKARRRFEELEAIAAGATPDTVNVARLQIDTAKWQLARILPKLYGDKISGEFNVNMSLEQLVLASIKLRDDPTDDPDPAQPRLSNSPKLSGGSELLPADGQQRAPRGHARGPNGFRGRHLVIEHEPAQPRPRGRPRKVIDVDAPKRPRGRPRKIAEG